MENLKLLRKKNNVTQEELARLLNIKQSTYSGYETNNSEPDLATLIKLANYFNVSLDYLCDRQDSNRISYIPEDRQKLIRYLLCVPYSVINQVEIFLKGYNTGKSEKQEINFYNPGEENE